MNNRLAMALAVAGGYVLGRTKKAKLAFGLGTMVLGKRLKLSPQQILGVVNKQLANNPALAGLRDELRDDLKGAGKAAAGALVTRQLNDLADSLHGRTQSVRERLNPGALFGGRDEDEEHDARDAHEAADAGHHEPDEEYDEAGDEPREGSSKGRDDGRREEGVRDEGGKAPAERAVAKKAAAKKPAVKKPPAKRVAKQVTGKKTAAGQGRPRKKTASREPGRPARSTSRRTREGGGEQ